MEHRLFERTDVAAACLSSVCRRSVRPTSRDPKPGDGYQAAVVNFKFIASKALTTREAVDALR